MKLYARRRSPPLPRWLWANFIAAIVTANTIGVASRILRHHQVVNFKESPHEWSSLRDFVASTYAGRDAPPSEAYVQTWERLGYSMGDFGGALHAFSTHAKDTDWLRFLDALHQRGILLAEQAVVARRAAAGASPRWTGRLFSRPWTAWPLAVAGPAGLSLSRLGLLGRDDLIDCPMTT